MRLLPVDGVPSLYLSAIKMPMLSNESKINYVKEGPLHWGILSIAIVIQAGASVVLSQIRRLSP
jgi:hypothetical protein